MNELKVIELSAHNWKDFSRNAHLICFSEERDPETDRIDYALLAVENDVPLGFVTVRDLDQFTTYWQYGGSFPGTRGTAKALRIYRAFIDDAKARSYERIVTRIRNTNRSMLKLALHVGFITIGVRLFDGEVYLEQMLILKEK